MVIKKLITAILFTGILGCSMVTLQTEEEEETGGENGGGNGGTPVEFELDTALWQYAGYPGDIPDISSNIINVQTEGAASDGSSDVSSMVQGLINSASGTTVLYFPAGTYRFTSGIDLESNIVIRGAGADQTTLEFETTDHCFTLGGSSGGWVSITGGLEFGSDTITVSNASGFTVGEGAEIQQDDIVPPMDASWGSNAPGQVVKITSIVGNTLTIDPPLHFEYSSSYSPEIQPIEFVKEVGFEDFRLHRVGSGDSGSNFRMYRSADSWVRRVDSDNTLEYHFRIDHSVHLEIRDSYIHGAEHKGNGGQGYGTSLSRHATSILVENNIFYDLRHSMIIQLGANACVFGYNFSEKNYSDNDGWIKPHISLHGHYAYRNLFEGNVTSWAYVGDYWGKIGPGNFLFRNKITGREPADTNIPNIRDRGIWIGQSDDSGGYDGPQYIVGNEITDGNGIYINVNEATHDLDDIIIHGNNEMGTIEWDDTYDATHTLSESQYLAAKPAFYGSMDMPSLGGDQVLGTGTIPAEQRWNTNDSSQFIPD